MHSKLIKSAAIGGFAGAFAIVNCLAIAATKAESRDAKKSPAAARSSLDDELLRSLEPKTAETADERQTAATVKSTERPAERPAEKPSDDVDKPTTRIAKSRKLVGPIDEELRRSLGGEDLGNAGEDIGENKLTKIIRQMQSVKERLAKSNSGTATRKEQQQIAAELAALVEQLRKQCSQCQGGQCKGGSKPSSGKPSSKPGNPNQTAGKSPATDTPNNPARNSTTQARPNRSDRPDPLATNELVKKALDGLNLPEKDREQMLQAAPDEFLPNFEFSIRKYFERIVEEEGDK
jgi:hypothetical protein